MKQLQPLEIINPNRDWVLAELERLHTEWKAWETSVSQIIDQPYDQNTHSEVFADGEDNMRRHIILQARTLTFLNNNVRGHGFIDGFEGDHIDRTDLRLAVRVKHRMLAIDVLQASLPYAKVPEGFWKQRGKELIETLSKKSGEAAVDIVASYLKNPFGGEKSAQP